MARAAEQHKTKPAKRTSRRSTSRQSGRGSQNNPSKTEQPSPGLSIVGDVFPRWRDRVRLSQEAADKLEALLRNRETRSAFVSAGGELWPLDGEFWRDLAHLEVVPDADGFGDRLEVRRPHLCKWRRPLLGFAWRDVSRAGPRRYTLGESVSGASGTVAGTQQRAQTSPEKETQESQRSVPLWRS